MTWNHKKNALTLKDCSVVLSVLSARGVTFSVYSGGIMGDLSKNFSRWEFQCKCGCGYDTVDYLLLSELQKLRDELNSAISINSGSRCKNHNSNVGGSSRSMHVQAKAADIVVSGYTSKEVFDILTCRFPNYYGKGLYNSFVHFDVRETPATWEG